MAENDFRERHAATARWVRFSEQLTALGRLVRDGLTDRLESRALGWAQFSLLWACRESTSGGISQNELSTLLGVSSAHVSGLVEQLRCKGLVVGRRAAPDRRRQLWQLTPEGQALIEGVLGDLVDWAHDWERRLGAEDTNFLDRVVQRLTSQISAGQGDVVDVVSRRGAA